MAAPRGVPRGLLGLLALAAVYFAAAKLGLMLAFVHASATAVWPPTGIALASMLLLGPRVWPAILLGAFLANVTTAGNLWTSRSRETDRKSTRLNSSHRCISYAVFCLKKKNTKEHNIHSVLRYIL